MEKTVKQRDSNLELLRIVAMLMIVAHHYVVNSGLMAGEGPILSYIFAKQSLFLLVLGAWGKPAINCFLFITGYFMCCSEITVRKFLKLLLEVMFYESVIQLAFWFSGYEAFSAGALWGLLIPVSKIGTGFTSAYLVFFLFIPFLNILIRNMREAQHLALVLLSVFLYVVLGSFGSVTMNYVSWFSVVYLISAYIRLYPKRIFSSRKFWTAAMIVSVCVTVCSVLFCTWTYAAGRKWSPYTPVQDANMLLSLLIGLTVFLFFKNLPIGYSKVINAFGASTFGVLQIHASSNAMRRWLWVDVLNNVGAYYRHLSIPHSLLSVASVFAVCALLDLLRIRFIEKPFFAIWDREAPRLSAGCRNAVSEIMRRVHKEA